jgi:hypothetical protein
MPGMTPARRRPAAPSEAEVSQKSPPAPTRRSDKTKPPPPSNENGPSTSNASARAKQRVEVLRRWPAEDYGSTRLVNMRVPVDLHERYKALLREVERRFPTLRHPSLTEYVIALLEESEPTPEGVAAVIRRKRVDQSTRA